MMLFCQGCDTVNRVATLIRFESDQKKALYVAECNRTLLATAQNELFSANIFCMFCKAFKLCFDSRRKRCFLSSTRNVPTCMCDLGDDIHAWSDGTRLVFYAIRICMLFPQAARQAHLLAINQAIYFRLWSFRSKSSCISILVNIFTCVDLILFFVFCFCCAWTSIYTLVSIPRAYMCCEIVCCVRAYM